MSARACIDPNVRVRNNETFVGFENCAGDAVVGEPIEVYEAETGAWTKNAFVTGVDFKRRLVYIAVDWRSLATEPHRFTIRTQLVPRSEDTNE